jgi:Na+/H+ antiporter NhaD/arsenite permease-like protein
MLRLLLLLILLLPNLASAANFSGTALSLYWSIPFLGILFSIALLPIICPSIWHHHFGKIILSWTTLFLLPLSYYFGIDQSLHIVTHAILKEFIPFILLLLALFTVSGGIVISGHLVGSPKSNTILLAIGTLLASIMGTTGAAMLMIRPLIRANQQRQYQRHIIIFFIFLVANIGGGLTPLGDPPLFIGFLNGIDFFWTIKTMALPVVICTAILLAIFYSIDHYYYQKEQPTIDSINNRATIHIQGKWNIALLIAIIGCIFFTGIWTAAPALTIWGILIPLTTVIQASLLLLITIISLYITPSQFRQKNHFNWDPIIEVAKLFIGIFITIAPVLMILKVGKSGALAPLVSLVSDADQQPINMMYFWLTGALSGFLDNAPTYLVFFNLAAGDPITLMTTKSTTLLAISMGSVFMGALTYIGNAPNFMIKNIALQHNITMPNFLSYMKWSIAILIPTFLLLSILFFRY